jgi:hypothetical protein
VSLNSLKDVVRATMDSRRWDNSRVLIVMVSWSSKIKAPMIESDKLKVTIVPIREGTGLHRNRGKTRILYD